MSDLISREVVLEYLRHQHNSIIELPGVPSSLKVLALGITDDCMDYIDKLESSYDVDKVVEILDKEAHMLYSLQAFEPVKAWRNEYLIPIVRSGGTVSLMDIVEGAVNDE